MTRSEKIQELSEIWGKIVGVDHHKSSDVVHYISVKYQFGAIEYHVEHGAYIGDSIDKTFNTLESAELYLIEEFSRQIKEQIKDNILRCENEEEYSQTVKPKEYWQKLNEEFKRIESLEVDGIKTKIDEEEYWKLKHEIGHLKYEINYADEILKKYGVSDKIDKESANYGLKASLGHRIEYLIEEIKKEMRDT